MNTIWSDYVQNTGTLYLSRMLRFSDEYRRAYMDAFDIAGRKRILEIGCGPGALTQALARWYPDAEIVGTDRDSAFVRFAAQRAPGLKFMEADAAALPFEDASFDVTISNTVQEHVEPSAFFGEQFRVLKPGGVCLVLSARRGINITSDCVAEQSSLEKEVWARASALYQDINSRYGVGQYAMSESELPRAMEQYGFRQVSIDYAVVNLTPDDPRNSRELACAMIDAHRQTSIDAADSLLRAAPGVVSVEEVREMKGLIGQRYDKRMKLYNAGIKQWDTSTSLTMVLRGVK
ncbi:MAG: methyltransferase domain-containing protein [Eubacterium sp.]|nr:methyltransferase domain-containing protein [Eubacterium sp.]MCM1216131.1 methyltransferase domain-containing protein [Lachnospiraceae bacterium]MCM1239097.1 methyltransferase domain-containing protein [Lachnospiraceae bacterium]